MEQFVTNVRNKSSNSKFLELTDYLRRSNELLRKNVNHLSTVLETLDYNQHSLGVMAVLNAKLQAEPVEDWADLFCKISIFVSECNDEQIRFSPHGLAEFCNNLANVLIQKGNPIVGLPLMLRCIGKLQVAPSSLSSIAVAIFKICLASKCFHPAFKFLKADVSEIMPEAASDPQNILLYFYYGALILIAVKDYDRALYFLEACLTTPAVAVSLIMVEAFKKHLLVSLIIGTDKLKDQRSLPRHTSPVVMKSVKGACQQYNELAQAFSNNSISDALEIVALYDETYTADQNKGLVSQAIDSLTKMNIRRLTKTFLTLSLADVASRAGLSSPEEAEKWLVIMIEEGSIFASISQKDGMVRFDTNPERYNSVSMLKKLEGNIVEAMGLDMQVTAMDEEICLNSVFISRNLPAMMQQTLRRNSDYEMSEDAGISQSPSRPSSSGLDGTFFPRLSNSPQGN